MFRNKCTIPFILYAIFAANAQQATVSVSSIEELIRSQQYDAALAATKAALHATPNDFRLWTLEGIVFAIKGANPDALKALQRALALSPNYRPALKAEAQLLYQAQDKRAIAILERILNADPKDETAHEMLAILEAKQEHCQVANSHFLLSAEVIAHHPQSLEAYGYCLVHVGQPDKAVSVFEQLAALLPEQTYPKYDLAVVLVETKQDEAAARILGPLLTADQSDPELLSLASDAYEALGDTPKAVSLLRQAIVLSPANANYYNAFVVLCLNHESFQVGVDMVDAGLQRITDDPSLYISRGLLYAQLAQYDKAEADFHTAEHLDSAQSLSAYASDIVELQKDMAGKSNPDEALLGIRAQLKAHPESALLHYLLAKLLVYRQPDADSKVSGEAIGSALLAVKLKPDLVDARDLLASIYTRSGQYDLAIEQCRLALQNSPSDETAIYHLIVALRHSPQKNQPDEIPILVKRLSQMQQASRQQQTDRKRFQLLEQQPVPAQ
jgi:tetratricopeptide (TPR) repeat protein